MKKLFKKSSEEENLVAVSAAQTNSENALVEQNPLLEDTSDLQPEGQKKVSKFTYIDYIWTIISALFAISSSISFVSKKWVPDQTAYILIALLAIYIISFIAIIVISFKHGVTKKSAAQMKTLRTNIKLFKAFANIVFLAISCMSLYGMISSGLDLGKFISSIFVLLVAIVKLALKLTKIIIKKVNKKIAAKFKTSITTYVDGKKKSQSIVDKTREKFKNKE